MAKRLHRLASLLVRDYTIMAKRHYDLSRDCRAIAGTWRQVLDDTPLDVLKRRSREDGMVAAPPVIKEESAYQKSFEEIS